MGKVYDSNAMVITHAVAELGCEPIRFGIIPDNKAQLEKAIRKALKTDFIILSGGTSKGEGDLNYRVFEKFSNPDIAAQLGLIDNIIKPSETRKVIVDSFKDLVNKGELGDKHGNIPL